MPGDLVLENEFVLIFNKYPLDHIQSLKFKPLCGTSETEQNKEVHVQIFILFLCHVLCTAVM